MAEHKGKRVLQDVAKSAKTAWPDMIIGAAVSDKGCLSVKFTVGNFPASLYRDQWQAVIEAVESGILQEALKRTGMRDFASRFQGDKPKGNYS